jgi:hypothetical protein
MPRQRADGLNPYRLSAAHSAAAFGPCACSEPTAAWSEKGCHDLRGALVAAVVLARATPLLVRAG